MAEKALRRLKIAATTALIGLTGFVGTAAASHNSLSCTPPDGMMPLFEFLHALEQVAFLGGATIGTLGFLVAGGLIMMPGQERTRRGKEVASNVFIGAILLFSAQIIMSFIIAQFPAGC
jgi:hypothetical protein